ncbi:MAG: ATP-grasp fold amidoligase family protein [Pseudomonadota bacterium]
MVDKFLWRKVFDHDPLSTKLSDKLASKQIALDLCPEVKMPRTLWTGQRFEDIPPELIAGDAVVKANHGSGLFQVIRNGVYDREEMIAMTRKWMATDYSRYHGEWNYRGIERKLFVEEFLKDADGLPVACEAKVYVFGDVALCAFYFHDRLTDKARQSLYDEHGNAYDFDQYLHYPVAIEPAPSSLPHVFQTAARLAAGRDHVRVDLYEIDGALYFSEFTFYNLGGRFGWGIRKEFPEMTRLWDLRRTWFLSQPQPGWRGAYANWLTSRLDCQAAKPDA